VVTSEAPKMRISRTSDVVNGIEDRMWTATCPCQPAPSLVMTFRCIRSDRTFKWARKHLNKYHPKEMAE
jgi:hypothetical protein